MRYRYTIEQMELLAAKRGGFCLSQRYRGSHTKLRWECRKGHTWSAKPNSVISDGSWCPRCARRSKPRRTIADYQKWAAAHGGRCLDSVARGVLKLHRFRCVKGHVFSMRPNNVMNGHWCPECWKKRRAVLNRERGKNLRAKRKKQRVTPTARANMASGHAHAPEA